MQVHGEKLWETYSPVVNWESVRILLTISLLQNLYARIIDFTLAFPQAKVEVPIYMEIPIGCTSYSSLNSQTVLLLLQSLYGLKQAAQSWFQNLTNHLQIMGFQSSKVDRCVLFRENIIIMTYIDDFLIFSKDKLKAMTLIEDLKNDFYLTDEGDASSYLGVQVMYNYNGSMSLTQPFLIEQIIDFLGNTITTANTQPTPAAFRENLHKDKNDTPRKQNWNYRSIVGMINYLTAMTLPYILFSVHQCARFFQDPK